MKLPHSTVLCALGAGLLYLCAADAQAFPHVVQEKDTLAELSTRYYGRVQYERLLAAANGLTGSARGLVPGQHLEVPALSYHRVAPNETWETLALMLLGGVHRSVVLAQINDQKPWIQPEVGQLIVVPYNLAWVTTEQDSLATLAYRFLGSTKYAYRIAQYNQLGDDALKRGQVLLFPVSDLALTPEGRRAADAAFSRMTEHGQGEQFEQQRAASAQVTQLAQDVHGGRYISAVARGNQLLSHVKLSEPSRTHIQLLLLESYVALDARGPARTACEAYRALEPHKPLDPVETSPKILKLCPNDQLTPHDAGLPDQPGPSRDPGSPDKTTDPSL
jgi:LysM repeat protein